MADKKSWNPNPGSVGEYFKNQNFKKSDWLGGAAAYEMDPEATYMSAKTDNAMAGVADSFNPLSPEERAALPKQWQKSIEGRDKAAAKKAKYGNSLNKPIKAKKTNGSSTKDFHQHTKMTGPGDVTIKDNLMSRFPDKESYNEYKDAERKGQVERADDSGAKAILAKLWVARFGTDEEFEDALTEVGQDIIDNPHHYGMYSIAFKGNKSLMNFIDEVKHSPKGDLDDDSNPVPDPNDTDWEDPDAEEQTDDSTQSDETKDETAKQEKPEDEDLDEPDEEKSMTDNMSIDEIKDAYAKQEKLEAKEAKEDAEAAKAKADREEYEAMLAKNAAELAKTKALIEGKDVPEQHSDDASGFKDLGDSGVSNIEGRMAAASSKATKEWNQKVKENPALGRNFPEKDDDFQFDPADYDKELYKMMSTARYKKTYPGARKGLDSLLRDIEINPKLKGTFGYTDDDIKDYRRQIAVDEEGKAKHVAAEEERIAKFLDDIARGEYASSHPSWNADLALKHRSLWNWDRQRLLKMLRAQEAEETRDRQRKAAIKERRALTNAMRNPVGKGSYNAIVDAADPDNLSGNENRMTYGDLANLANIISGRRW